MDRRQFMAATGAVGAGLMGLSEAAAKEAGDAAPPATPRREPKATLEQGLSDLCAAFRYDTLPASSVQAVKRLLLDTLGCGYGALGAPPAVLAEKVFRATYATRDCASVLGNAQLIGTEGATLINGILIRYQDMNDIYVGRQPTHPSELIPAALAACEEAGRSGRDLIEAIAVGYEATIRLNDAMPFGDRGFYSTSAGGYVIPLVAGRAMRAPAEQVVQAMGIAGPRQFALNAVTRGDLSMMKALCYPHTAMDAIFALRLAAAGVTGAPGSLDWFVANVKPSDPDFGIDLDPTRHLVEKVGLKRFPVQYEIQSVAEAGVNLHGRIGDRISRIREIVVGTYPDTKGRVADPPKYAPQNRETADHSLPISAAMALIDGDVTPKQFHDERWRDRDVLTLAAKIRVETADALVAKRPKGRGATMDIRFDDGQTLSEIVEVPEGDAERPLSRGALEHKFMLFTAPVLGDARARRIVSLVDELDQIADVRTFTAALRGDG